jgi:Uma2 family endonuclease
MATVARRLLTGEEFLAIEFPSDTKAELDNGTIRMMSGGTVRHARLQGNIQFSLREKLRGSGCTSFGSDMAVRVHGLSIRYPDVSVYCGKSGPENDKLKFSDDPKMVVEVLSPTTRNDDETVKLREYLALPSLAHIMFVDPDSETIRLFRRADGDGWFDVMLENGADVMLDGLGISLTWAEIFARD